jgi:hypothetical protein
MNPTGGYFELELRKGLEYHKGLLKLNSGRNAFHYILRAKGYKKVYLPYYTCNAMLEPINRLKLDYEFYPIDERLDPLFDFKRVGEKETFVYTNYFGLKGKTVIQLSGTCPNLIIDNSQAFFDKPVPGIDTFYSPRKFFGVPDGSYLFTDTFLTADLSRDYSAVRISHLIKRIDEGAEAGYPDFKANDASLVGQPIKVMSALTKALLCNIDYRRVIKIRKKNFSVLNEHLKESNRLKVPEGEDFVPMVYPYLTHKGENLKEHLIRKKFFIPTYWPNVFNWGDKNMLEYIFAKHIVPLPIDQRHDKNTLLSIIKLLKGRATP